MKKTIKSKNESFLSFGFLILLRILFTGIGLGVLIGSFLKIISFNENSINLLIQNLFNKNEYAIKFNKNQLAQNEFLREDSFNRNLNPNKEINLLSSRWKDLASSKEDLKASAFVFLIDSGKYAELSPNLTLPAASSIKISILLLLLEMVDKGEILWNEKLELTQDLIGGGAGWMAYQQIGTKFPTYELATEMIRVSDNTATNILIKRIGGINQINQKLNRMGLESTQIKNLLPDLEGTNTTSSIDLTKILLIAESGNKLSIRSRDLFREIMSTSTSNRLLPGGILKGLGESDTNADYKLMIKGYKIYNKTGDIGIAYSDAGIIQLPDTKRAIAGFMVKGPFNDPRSSLLIKDMAEAMTKFIDPEYK